MDKQSNSTSVPEISSGSAEQAPTQNVALPGGDIGIKVTDDHVDALYDAITMMRLSAQLLSEGDVDGRTAGEISWMLGSCKKRLEPVIGLVERVQLDQRRDAL
jgi:hypothetical protein